MLMGLLSVLRILDYTAVNLGHSDLRYTRVRNASSDGLVLGLDSPPRFLDVAALSMFTDETFELTVGSLGPDEDPDSEQSEQQAVLRRMVCSEPVIIQENDRICVVRESGPLRTFTAM